MNNRQGKTVGFLKIRSHHEIPGEDTLSNITQQNQDIPESQRGEKQTGTQNRSAARE
jgi:hypothetical protein